LGGQRIKSSIGFDTLETETGAAGGKIAKNSGVPKAEGGEEVFEY